MASMVFASLPLSAQSHVKLRTNSNYPRSSCYVPLQSKPNSYVHLSYNISDIESSKSSFTKGDGFSEFSLLKFPRVASTVSPSLNIIKASMDDSIYRFDACKLEKKQGPVTRTDIPLSDYTGKVLLIVNIPQQGSEWSKSQIGYLNKLRKKYCTKGFEVLGFLYDKNELEKQEHFRARWKGLFHHHKNELDEKSVTEILGKVEFPIFGMVELNREYGHGWVNQRKEDKDLWHLLRNKTISGGEEENKIKEDFEAFLVDRQGIPQKHYPRFDYETFESQPKVSGGDPGPSAGQRPDTRYPIENEIAQFFKEW
ncbi:phospholipid hydroperoxide glutathione peroxidase, chloroplastic-like [Lycium barbarum]|uniref:phospholipid hydroperoxide glutathione peroxidase, chloroplastic-like n=1 Tax=Lycium barbarum TaxID=112863 RepID=UPI00293E6A95|nr:phospholipid hydroperoxide glutathione peroxidase, chloroplastic-like [Lycium barbarum]